MTSPIEPSADDELQFNTTESAGPEVAGPAVQGCARCHRPITGEYFAVRNHPICAACRTQLEPPPPGTRFTRLAKAGLLGLGAGLAGALIWYVVRRVTQMEIGLIAVLVGFMVGKAVRYGSGNRGGRGYQILAVVLTYCCIAANYMPDIVEGLLERVHNDNAVATSTNVKVGAAAGGVSAVDGDSSPANTTTTTTVAATPHPKPGVLKFIGALIVVAALVFAFSMAAPFLMGVQNILGLLIIGFALWEAWKFTRKTTLPITGPYQVGGRPMVTGSLV